MGFVQSETSFANRMCLPTAAHSTGWAGWLQRATAQHQSTSSP